MADIRRPRYFRYQFLLENDFNEEQAYHVQMRHLQNNYLRSPGVVSGLEVEKVGPKEVRVRPGMAIDENGQEIVVPSESPAISVPLSGFDANDEVYIAIQYIEEDDALSEAEIGGSTVYTRVFEKASAFGTTTNPDSDPTRVCLGKVALDASGDIIDPYPDDSDDTTGPIDFSVRQESTADIADSSIGETKLADGAVTGDKIADNAISAAKIADLSISAADLAGNAVTSAKIDEADGSSGQNTNAGSGVKTGHIQNGAVNEAKLADNAVTSAKLREADNSTGQNTNSGSGVKTNHIQNLAVTTGKLAANVQATLNNAVPNTGGTINGQLQVRDRLSTYVTVAGATPVNGVHSSAQSSGTGNVTGNITIAASDGAGTKTGVSASASGTNGHKYGGRFSASTTGTGSEQTRGLQANGSSSGSGIVFGVEASASGSGSGNKYGISVRADAAAGHKYAGEFYARTSGSGAETTYGVNATANSSGSGQVFGTYANATGSGTGTKYGVNARADAAAGNKYGGYFYARTTGSGGEATRGVYALATSSGSGPVYGVGGSVSGDGSGPKYAIYGSASGSGAKYAIYGSASGSGTLYAGYFNGRVHINGQLTKSSGSFLIDHVLDPKNKTLRHSFVESPEDLCLYRGKVKLDEKGRATVKMPRYFAALTKEEEATVTLTPIGKKPFLAGYEWNKKYTAFSVYGDPDRQVSYIVLADRDDPAIRHFRRPVEEAKGNGNFEKGKLINPEAYGEPPEVELDVEKEEKERLKEEKHIAGIEIEDKKSLKAFEAFMQASEQSRTELRRTIKEGEKVLEALDKESAKEHEKLIGKSEVKDQQSSSEGSVSKTRKKKTAPTKRKKDK